MRKYKQQFFTPENKALFIENHYKLLSISIFLYYLFIHVRPIFPTFLFFLLGNDVNFEHTQHYKKDDNQRTQRLYIQKLL